MQSSVLSGTDLSDFVLALGRGTMWIDEAPQCSLLAPTCTSWSKIVRVNRPGGEKQDSI